MWAALLTSPDTGTAVLGPRATRGTRSGTCSGSHRSILPQLGLGRAHAAELDRLTHSRIMHTVSRCFRPADPHSRRIHLSSEEIPCVSRQRHQHALHVERPRVGAGRHAQHSLAPTSHVDRRWPPGRGYRVLRTHTRHGRTGRAAARTRLTSWRKSRRAPPRLRIERPLRGPVHGGMIAQVVALKHSRCSAAWSVHTSSRVPLEARPMWKSASGRQSSRHGAACRADHRPLVHGAVRGHAPGDRRTGAHHDPQTEPQGYVGCCHAIKALDLTDGLSAISVPTLIVGSERTTLGRRSPPPGQFTNGSRVRSRHPEVRLAPLQRRTAGGVHEGAARLPGTLGVTSGPRVELERAAVAEASPRAAPPCYIHAQLLSHAVHGVVDPDRSAHHRARGSAWMRSCWGGWPHPSFWPPPSSSCVRSPGRIHGRKRVYAGGVALFTLASLLCGLAPSVGLLIAFRALQGVGAR